MGRYYSGDIEGKFWFGVQSSDDAGFFGGEVVEPNYIQYSFDKERDMEDVEKGLKTCYEKMGDKKQKLDVFFENEGKEGYNNEMIEKALGLGKDEVTNLLVWYARAILGEKIKKGLEENDFIEFDAEL